MPREIRRIYFTDDEIAKAILALNNHSRNKFLIPGSLCGVEVRSEPSLGLEVKVENLDGKVESVLLDETVVGAAIIRYCIDTHVPLPFNGSKSLKLLNGKLALDVAFDSNAAKRAAPPEPVAKPA